MRRSLRPFLSVMLLASLSAIASCFNPPTPLCAFSCAEAPNLCPQGYECRSDRYCHAIGTSGVCPGFPQLDSGPADASDGPMDAPSDATDGPSDGAPSG